ncbi:DAPG hydrolase family protein [Mycolicibacterium sp. CBM1]
MGTDLAKLGAQPRGVDTVEGRQADQTLLGLDSAASLLDEGYQQTENGYGALRGGGFHVAVRTGMPGVTPAMWDWWFGWHGSDSRRYSEADGRWVGRTSIIEEYLGSAYAKAAIQFLEPAALGLDTARLGTDIAVCARLGSSELPVDIGLFIHHIRATPAGAEMRSRFWMGGPYTGVRRGNRLADSVIRPIAAHQWPDPRDLLVHCAQEMNHLAGFLPALFGQLGAAGR